MSKLKALMKQRRITQVELREISKTICKVPLPRYTINRIYQGKLTNYSMDTLIKLCRVLEVTPNEILSKSDYDKLFKVWSCFSNTFYKSHLFIFKCGHISMRTRMKMASLKWAYQFFYLNSKHLKAPYIAYWLLARNGTTMEQSWNKLGTITCWKSLC